MSFCVASHLDIMRHESEKQAYQNRSLNDQEHRRLQLSQRWRPRRACESIQKLQLQ